VDVARSWASLDFQTSMIWNPLERASVYDVPRSQGLHLIKSIRPQLGGPATERSARCAEQRVAGSGTRQPRIAFTDWPRGGLEAAGFTGLGLFAELLE
jgi:hypothetical protein